MTNRIGFASPLTEYTASEAYGLPDLTAKSWDALTTRMESNSTLLDQFRLFEKSSAVPAGDCDIHCRHTTLCSLRSATVTLYEECLAKIGSTLD